MGMNEEQYVCRRDSKAKELGGKKPEIVAHVTTCKNEEKPTKKIYKRGIWLGYTCLLQ